MDPVAQAIGQLQEGQEGLRRDLEAYTQEAREWRVGFERKFETFEQVIRENIHQKSNSTQVMLGEHNIRLTRLERAAEHSRWLKRSMAKALAGIVTALTLVMSFWHWNR